MKRRLLTLEHLSRRVESDTEYVRAAQVSHWRHEFTSTLDIEEVIELTREVHAGNTKARDGVARIIAAENEYVRARAAEGP